MTAAQAALRAASSPAESGKSLAQLGFLYYTSGNTKEGEKYLQESLAVRTAAFGSESLDYAETANYMAMLLRDLGRMAEAKRFAQQAVDTRRRLLGDHDPALAESLNTLATVYGLAGEYVTAVSTFERAIAIHESRPPRSARRKSTARSVSVSPAPINGLASTSRLKAPSRKASPPCG